MAPSDRVPLIQQESAMKQIKRSCLVGTIATVLSLALRVLPAAGQGVTTAAVTGLVKDAQGGVIPGATIIGVHEPSGTTYEGVTQGDGRYYIPGMRIGGPYKVSASLSGFSTEGKNNISLSLVVAQDLDFTLKVAAVADTITVVRATTPACTST